MMVGAGGIAALLAVAFLALLEIYDRVEAGAEQSCLASIGAAFAVMPTEDFAFLPDPGTQWRVLTENERAQLLEAAARARALDCRSRRREGFLDRRYSEPRIEVRRTDDGLEFLLRVEAAPRFYQIDASGEVLQRLVKIRLAD